jgi:hypothetical protein
VAGGIAFASISSGWSHTCGMSLANATHSNATYCWGDNSSQQLGRPTADDFGGVGPLSGKWNFSSVRASASSTFGFLHSTNGSDQADVLPVVPGVAPVPPSPVDESSSVPIGAVVGGVVGGLGEHCWLVVDNCVVQRPHLDVSLVCSIAGGAGWLCLVEEEARSQPSQTAAAAEWQGASEPHAIQLGQGQLGSNRQLSHSTSSSPWIGGWLLACRHHQVRALPLLHVHIPPDNDIAGLLLCDVQ